MSGSLTSSIVELDNKWKSAVDEIVKEARRLFEIKDDRIAELERQLETYRRTAQENGGAACDALVMSEQLTELRGQVAILNRQLAEGLAREAALREYGLGGEWYVNLVELMEKAPWFPPGQTAVMQTIPDLLMLIHRPADDTALRQAIEAAKAEERGRICQQLDDWHMHDTAEAIRARGEKCQ